MSKILITRFFFHSLLKLESVIDSMIVSIDTVWGDCTHSIYSDEYVMWIGGDGDTIWE